MSLLALSLLFVVQPADKPEDQAKEVARTFLKAVTARNVDEAAKLSGTPFLSTHDGKPRLLEKADDVKDELKSAIDQIKDTSSFPTDVLEVIPAAKVKDKFGEKARGEVFGLIEKAMGKDGFIVTLGKDAKPRGAVIVAMKDGKAKIAGIPK